MQAATVVSPRLDVAPMAQRGRELMARVRLARRRFSKFWPRAPTINPNSEVRFGTSAVTAFFVSARPKKNQIVRVSRGRRPARLQIFSLTLKGTSNPAQHERTLRPRETWRTAQGPHRRFPSMSGEAPRRGRYQKRVRAPNRGGAGRTRKLEELGEKLSAWLPK